jgi:hypothetical protein
LIIFRIVLLIILGAAAAAWVLVLLLGEQVASLLTARIGLIALLAGVIFAGALPTALLLTLGMRH